MNLAKIVLLTLFCLPLGRLSIKAKLPSRFIGKVIAISDGDTIEVLYNEKPLKIRFAHIDCPELKRHQPFGMTAKQFTSAMCFAQWVTIQNENKFDRYHRLISEVINAAGKNVNKELVKAGLAWHFKKYSTDKDYAALQNEAKAKRIGLWQQEHPITPWDWRSRKK